MNKLTRIKRNSTKTRYFFIPFRLEKKGKIHVVSDVGRSIISYTVDRNYNFVSF